LAKGERPVYSELAEGIDNDGDGQINEDPPGGVNLNRNWPYHWAEFNAEAGFCPAAELETHALIQFTFDHPEIAVIWSFGLNDNLIAPPKKPESSINDADLPIFVELSRLYCEARSGSHGKPRTETRRETKLDRSMPALTRMLLLPAPATAAPVAAVTTLAAFAAVPITPAAPVTPAAAPTSPGATTDGAFSEWAYFHYGVIGLASRLWQGPELSAATLGATGSVIPSEGEQRWLYWNDHIMGGRAFLPFTVFKHPTLGLVELGGWKPGVRLNPPIDEVKQIAEVQVAFLDALAHRLSHLGISEVKIEHRGGGIYQVSASIVNEGDFPTALAQGVHNRKADPVRVQFDPGINQLLAGPRRIQIDRLPGAGGHRQLRWLVFVSAGPSAAAKPATVIIHVSSPKSGEAVRSIPLIPPK
jgi:hypothetical protein